MNDLRQPGTKLCQAIYLANPRREDKDDILVRDIDVLEGYPPVPVAEVLKPYVDHVTGAPPTGGPA
jgi:hypothetical protein